MVSPIIKGMKTMRCYSDKGFIKPVLLILCFIFIACTGEQDYNKIRTLDQDGKDFGAGAVIHYEDCTTGNLFVYLNSIKTIPGNYVVNITGNAVFTDYVLLSKGVKISLRGDGGIITAPEAECIFAVDKGAKLVLRDITLDGKYNDYNYLIYLYGEMSMEDGSLLTRGQDGAIDIEGGYFIMNGGEIRECGGDFDTISVRGAGARFQKNPGGIIRGKNGDGANNPEKHVIGVWSSLLYKLCYRDEEIGSKEILRLWLNSEGKSISFKSGKWDMSESNKLLEFFPKHMIIYH